LVDGESGIVVRGCVGKNAFPQLDDLCSVNLIFVWMNLHGILLWQTDKSKVMLNFDYFLS
jgi:hypothetical protein